MSEAARCAAVSILKQLVSKVAPRKQVEDEMAAIIDAEFAAIVAENERLKLDFASCHQFNKELNTVNERLKGILGGLAAEAFPSEVAAQARQLNNDNAALRQQVAELQADIDKYRSSIGICSGSCVDHRGNIWEEPSRDA